MDCKEIKEAIEFLEKARSVARVTEPNKAGYKCIEQHIDQALIALTKLKAEQPSAGEYDKRTIENTYICTCGNVFVEADDYDTAGSESGVCCPHCGNEKFQTVKDRLDRAEASLLKALEPVLEWYGSGTEGNRSGIEILTDVVADLQKDRAEVLKQAKLRTEQPKCKTCGGVKVVHSGKPTMYQCEFGECETVKKNPDACKTCGKTVPCPECMPVANDYYLLWHRDLREMNLAKRQVAELKLDNSKEASKADLLEACERARRFIRNGIELGYIKMPEIETDPAHKTLPIIEAAIAKAEKEG